ncbi:hypothetical protein BD413DRAFT_120035 [Trametes elegans]|nr:hypothetical protein BD413DRAFT_120035 [Trametes elegans]
MTAVVLVKGSNARRTLPSTVHLRGRPPLLCWRYMATCRPAKMRLILAEASHGVVPSAHCTSMPSNIVPWLQARPRMAIELPGFVNVGFPLGSAVRPNPSERPSSKSASPTYKPTNPASGVRIIKPFDLAYQAPPIRTMYVTSVAERPLECHLERTSTSVPTHR